MPLRRRKTARVKSEDPTWAGADLQQWTPEDRHHLWAGRFVLGVSDGATATIEQIFAKLDEASQGDQNQAALEVGRFATALAELVCIAGETAAGASWKYALADAVLDLDPDPDLEDTGGYDGGTF